MNTNILEIIESYLSIPQNLLQWPDILTNLIVPFILLSYALKLVLGKLRIFRSESLHMAIAVLISFAFTFTASSLLTSIAPGSIFMICLLKIRGWKGIVLGFVLTLFYIYAIPTVTSTLKNLIPV